MNNEDITFFEMPEHSDWECQLFGGGAMGVVYRPPKGGEPNWFWRKMQYLCFGCRWVKVEASS